MIDISNGIFSGRVISMSYFQVEFKADRLHLPLLKLAKEGNRLITSSGFISYSCRPVELARPVAFTSEESHVVSNYLNT